MRVRLHIETLAIEADWPRAHRADFSAALRVALEKELSAAAQRGALHSVIHDRRRGVTVPSLTLSRPQSAGAHLAKAIVGALAPGGQTVATPARGGSR